MRILFAVLLAWLSVSCGEEVEVLPPQLADVDSEDTTCSLVTDAEKIRPGGCDGTGPQVYALAEERFNMRQYVEIDEIFWSRRPFDLVPQPFLLVIKRPDSEPNLYCENTYEIPLVGEQEIFFAKPAHWSLWPEPTVCSIDAKKLTDDVDGGSVNETMAVLRDACERSEVPRAEFDEKIEALRAAQD